MACCWLLAAISLESRRGESAWRDGMCCRHHGWRGGTSRHLPQTTPPCGMTTMLQLMLPRQQPWLSQPPAKHAGKPLWFTERGKRITASVAHSILRLRETTNPARLVQSTITRTNDNTEVMQYGRDHEAVALILLFLSCTH